MLGKFLLKNLIFFTTQKTVNFHAKRTSYDIFMVMIYRSFSIQIYGFWVLKKSNFRVKTYFIFELIKSFQAIHSWSPEIPFTNIFEGWKFNHKRIIWCSFGMQIFRFIGPRKYNFLIIFRHDVGRHVVEGSNCHQKNGIFQKSTCYPRGLYFRLMFFGRKKLW